MARKSRLGRTVFAELEEVLAGELIEGSCDGWQPVGADRAIECDPGLRRGVAQAVKDPAPKPARGLRERRLGEPGGSSARPRIAGDWRRGGAGPGGVPAPRLDRTLAAARIPRPAERRADVHERVRPLAGPIGRDERVGRALELSGRRRLVEEGPAEHPPDVRVDRPEALTEGERGQRPRRVRADARQRVERREIARHPAAVSLDDHPGGRPKRERTAVVAQPAPGPQRVGGARLRERSGRRELDEERPPRLGRAGGLGLLGHELRHEDRPRVARRAEGEDAAAGPIPAEDGRTQPRSDRIRSSVHSHMNSVRTRLLRLRAVVRPVWSMGRSAGLALLLVVLAACNTRGGGY